jgi:hypothetical protein
MDTSLKWKIFVGQDLPVGIKRWEEKWKAATIMEEPNVRLHEKQKHGRRYGIK